MPKLYWPTCGPCQYEKRNPELKKQLAESSYFDPQGKEPMMSVWKRWGLPFPEPTIYSHMRRHRPKKIEELVHIPDEALKVEYLDPESTSTTAHEKGLDEIIAKGRNMLRTGELKITTTALLTAIRTKGEFDYKKKDQGLEAMKLMAGAFGGTNPGTTENSDTEG